MPHWCDEVAPQPDESFSFGARNYQLTLTKPPGSLGRLEELAIRLAAMQGTNHPAVKQPGITVFAADHGIAEEGVSAFPQSVTAEMVRNFSRGGAAISVLARELQATLEVVNMGTVEVLEPLEGVIDARIGPGTKNFVHGAAMEDDEMQIALQTGRTAVERQLARGADLFIGGDMGIANTTSASTIACALLNAQPRQLAGPGTGLDRQGISHKAGVITSALDANQAHRGDPAVVLRYFGGFEIAALAGAYVRCAQLGLPMLVDGFISSVAALAAVRLKPDVLQWMFIAHRSAEPGHAVVVDALGHTPLLDLGMRLGEGSGAAVAVPLLRLACSLHCGMATFAEAGISEKLG